MIKNDKFMEQFKALEDSDNFIDAIKYPLVNREEPESGHDDKKFSEGIRQYGEWLKQTYA